MNRRTKKIGHAMDFTLSFAITYSVHSQQHHFSAPALPRIHGMAALSPGGQASEPHPAQWDTPCPAAGTSARQHVAPKFQLQLSTGHPFAFLLYCHADFYRTCRNLITLKTPILSWTQGKLIMGSKVIENEGQNRWTDRWNDCLCCCLRKQANSAGVSW